MNELSTYLKTHPYETGIAVIVLGLIGFYVISSNQSTPQSQAAAQVPAGTDPNASENVALANIQAGAAVAASQSNAQLQTAQIAATANTQQIQASADAQNLGTDAALVATLYQTQQATLQNQNSLAAQTAQQANELTYASNIQQEQDNVFNNQINAGVLEQANNNATASAISQQGYTYGTTVANLTAGLGSQALNESYNLQIQNQTAYNSQIPYIVANAGDQKNSALDATDQTSLFQTILSQGNAGVASIGSAGSSSTATANNGSVLGTVLGSLISNGASVGKAALA